MRKQKKLPALLLGLVMAFTCTGCSLSGMESLVLQKVVTSIEKTGSEGLVDIYTIYYSDGTTSTFEIKNGADGADGKDGENGMDGKDGVDSDDPPISIRAIEKTDTDGLVDTYTIYYTDGTTSTFQITNGADGQDGINGTNGKDVTALDLYETYKEIYGEDLSYTEFLSLYMTFDDNTVTDGSKVIQSCLQSVVKMYAEFTELDEETTEDTTDTKLAVYTGAGVIYRIEDDYTYFITNYHVTHDKDAVGEKISDTIVCYLYGSEGSPEKKTDALGNTYAEYGNYAIECEYIGGAVQYDIAIVRAKTSDVLAINENVSAVSFAEEYYVGQKAIAIGNPRGDGISVTEGIVCVENDTISLDIDGTSRSYRSIRIDTALYAGNSGGGLFNGYGELIGIANAGSTKDQNINFAVPLPIVKGVAENVMTHYQDGDDSTNGVYKITLGVTVTSQNTKNVYNEETGLGKIQEEVLITEITYGGCAYMMGLQKGDILKAVFVDGVEYTLDRYFEVGDILLKLTKDVTFSFVYQRNGEEKTTSSYTVKASDLAAVA